MFLRPLWGYFYIMRTILVIEDNKEIRENTAELLELNNYRVICARNGQVGFALAKQHHPDLVLCDMMMPDTDGLEFLHLAKNHSRVKTIPLIFFSAGSPAPDMKRKLVKAADYYLQKPFEEKDLLKAVGKVLKATRE